MTFVLAWVLYRLLLEIWKIGIAVVDPRRRIVNILSLPIASNFIKWNLEENGDWHFEISIVQIF